MECTQKIPPSNSIDHHHGTWWLKQNTGSYFCSYAKYFLQIFSKYTNALEMEDGHVKMGGELLENSTCVMDSYIVQMHRMSVKKSVLNGIVRNITGNVALMNVFQLTRFVMATLTGFSLDVETDQMKQMNCVPPGSAWRGTGSVGLMNVFQRSMCVMGIWIMVHLSAQMRQMRMLKCVLQSRAGRDTGDASLVNAFQWKVSVMEIWIIWLKDVWMAQMRRMSCAPPGSVWKGTGNVAPMNVF